jgi:nitrite reductase (NO-forming)
MSAHPAHTPSKVPPPVRRCQRRAIAPGSPRPSELLTAFFVAGLLCMAAAAVAGITYALSGTSSLHWLALHLLFLGGVSQLVLGAGQFFVCAFLATDPPPRRLVGAQLATWNVGTALVAVGVPTEAAGLVEAGGALIATGLILFALALRGMERRSLQHAPWALRWYQASAACLGLGALLGVLIARGIPWAQGSLLGAHLTLNLGGWLGTAIVGTLHTFFPSLTQTRLRYGRLQAPTFWLWLSGIVGLAAGAAFARAGLIVAGWTGLLLAASLLSVNLLASLRSAARPLPLPVRLLATAQAFLPAGLLLALLATVSAGTSGPFTGQSRAALAVMLAAGWIGLTVAGSLLHLLAILARIRRFALAIPRPRPARDRALAAAAGVGVGALALSHAPGLTPLAMPATALTAAVGVVLALGVLGLAWRAVGPHPS